MANIRLSYPYPHSTLSKVMNCRIDYTRDMKRQKPKIKVKGFFKSFQVLPVPGARVCVGCYYDYVYRALSFVVVGGDGAQGVANLSARISFGTVS